MPCDDAFQTSSVRDLLDGFAGADRGEAGEWLEALDAVIESEGPRHCRQLLEVLLEHARSRGVDVQPPNVPYCNTIPVSEQPAYPGDLELEARLTAWVRWNAMAMVVRANRTSPELGGHLATYASAADLYEVGFNHFFSGDDPEQPGLRRHDLVFFQPHSAPGIYARAFLEGRLDEQHLLNYRRETSGHGLPSYPHPRLMSGFWEFPTGSMGLGAITAVMQASFMRYLENRGQLPASGRRVWAFVGDGEMDEPESISGLTLAARERLDNLVFVINCNLQRLDGPVRGNGSIIRELDRLFAGAGWNVIKVLWGSDWDALFASDRGYVILRRLDETPDGELQTYAATDGQFNRERFFSRYPELLQLVSHLSDAQIDSLKRGGHDPLKIYAAYDAAVRHKGQPTVILAQTKKGYGLGRWAQGRMSAHQQKKLDDEALRSFRDTFDLPLSDADVSNAVFCRPPETNQEMRYLHECRRRLGGYVPAPRRSAPPLQPPAATAFAPFVFESGAREMSTTIEFVRMLSQLLKSGELGRRIVPIVADEARTFGMQALFRHAGIYSPQGQLYEPEDHADLLHYKESRDGQILEEGIHEAAALSSWIAAGTSYVHQGAPMLPFYIFYSMFGFQRVGDLIWAAADSRARGFLLGATAGRTTLSGEGLQHQDGTSHLLASTVPACRAYDPCYGYEIAIILEEGMRAMLARGEDVFYYLTLMNETYPQPSMPEGVRDGVLRGMYRVRTARDGSPRVRLLGSGTILREALAAAELLESGWEAPAEVWSVTSFTELRRDGLTAERHNRLHPNRPARCGWVEECLGQAPAAAPVIAATDYVRAVPDLIRTWVPAKYVALGTDGYGLSDTRAALRRKFEVDAVSIGYAALHAAGAGRDTLARFRSRYGFEAPDRGPWE